MESKQEVKVVEVDDMLVASIRYKGKYNEVRKYINRLLERVAIKTGTAPFALYYDTDYVEDNADIEVCVEVEQPMDVDDITIRMLDGGFFVSYVHVGSYAKLHQAYGLIEKYMKEHQLEEGRPNREVFLVGQGKEKVESERITTQVLMPIK